MASAPLLRDAGIEPRKRTTLRAATGEIVTREFGFAILSAEGYETADEVVFAEPGDLSPSSASGRWMGSLWPSMTLAIALLPGPRW